MSAYSERFDRAVALAVRDFRDILRKGQTTPYITHLFAVTARVGEAGGDEDQMIAAVLHDWLEDVRGASIDTLREDFGERVANMVLALSDSTGFPKPPWRARKEAYVAGLRTKAADVKLVSCCDKHHNALTIVRDLRVQGIASLDRFTGGREGTLWYYASVADALGDGWHAPVLDDLRGEVSHMHQLVGIDVGDAQLPG